MAKKIKLVIRGKAAPTSSESDKGKKGDMVASIADTAAAIRKVASERRERAKPAPGKILITDLTRVCSIFLNGMQAEARAVGSTIAVERYYERVRELRKAFRRDLEEIGALDFLDFRFDDSVGDDDV